MDEFFNQVNKRIAAIHRRAEIWMWIEHPTVTTFVQSAAWMLAGILLPTIFCGVLFHISGLREFLGYVQQELEDASFTFNATALLFVELVHTENKRFLPSLRWAIGIILLVVSMLFSCGIAVNQILVNRKFEVTAVAESLTVNVFFVTAIVVYLAAISATTESSYNKQEVNRGRVIMQYGLRNDGRR